MKNIYKYIVCLGLLSTCMVGCQNDDEGVVPSSLTNLRYESTSGRIVLRWNTPQDETVKYIKVNYYNPLTGKEEFHTASIYADSINIPNTRQKYGEYVFTVRTVGKGDDLGEAMEIKATSEPAEKTWIKSGLKLTAEMLETNAQESSEGPAADLLDDNIATYFHTSWSEDIPGPHYLKVTLPQTVDNWWQFYYAPRANGSNKPIDFDMEGSIDGQTWFLIKKFTKETDVLPVDSKTDYTSPRLNAAESPFKYLKLIVYDTNNHAANGGGGIFWTMSEFKVYNVDLIDPEALDEE